MASLTRGPNSPLSNYRVPNPGSWVHFCAGFLVSVFMPYSTGLHAASLDTLMNIDVTGRPLLLQHTIVSDGELVVFELPNDARFPQAHFMGPEHKTFSHAWNENPTRLALWSGSAILRHSQTADPATEEAAQLPSELTLQGYPATLEVEDGELAQWRLTLVFPVHRAAG